MAGGTGCGGSQGHWWPWDLVTTWFSPRGLPCSLWRQTRPPHHLLWPAGDLGVDATEWPARAQLWPPWKGDSCARAPICPPGDPRPLFRGAQPEPAACLDPLASRMATTRRGLLPPSSLRVIWSSRLWVLGGSAAGGLHQRPGRREAAFIFIAGPYGVNRRNMIFVTQHECKSHRLSHKAPETSPHKSNTICMKTTCIHHKLHHKN